MLSFKTRRTTRLRHWHDPVFTGDLRIAAMLPVIPGQVRNSAVDDPHISIVIPTRHEAATIGPFLRRVRSVLSETDFELIVVDDSDRDNTVEVLLDLQRELGSDRLVVVHRPVGSVPERTLGTAVVTGIRRARGTYVCVLDADGQHPPEAIPRMLRTARQTGADYVGGSRYVPGGSPAGLNGICRKGISRGLALLTRLAFLLTPVRSLTDPLSGFFLFRRSVVEGVELKPVGWKISLEVLIRSRAQNVTEVPYAFACRADGDSKASLQQGLLVLRHILVLLIGMAGVRRFALFGLVGLSGVFVNTGSVLALQALGFGALGWPLWIASELAILWNYTLNRHVTWRDRRYGAWWLYNMAALSTSGVAIAITTLLMMTGHPTLWLASVGGIAAGMGLNYVVLDRLVFSAFARLALAPGLRFLQFARRPEHSARG
jgi:dolichol-phosphate mannosyltransferase